MADQIRDGQWVLRNYGVQDRVWPISQGAGVTVAVIDSGVAEHQDLAGQVVQGTDVSGGGDPRVDSIGHGTGIAADIAGRGHGDRAGVMGLAPKAKIMPVKVMTQSGDRDGSFDSNQIADAIRYAVDHGAKVVNMSFGGVDGTNEKLRGAVAYAVEKEVVLVAASGNDGDRPGSGIDYPAGFPGVLVVGAVDRNGEVWQKSVGGKQLTVVAPGVDIYTASTTSNSSYATATGTSDSAAYVSAVAALVRSKYPNLSAGQVVNRMIKSAVQPDGKGPFPNDRFGYGIVSPAAALAANPVVDNGPKENPLLGRPEPNPKAAGHATASVDPAAPTPGGGQAAASSQDGSGNVGNKLLVVAGAGLGLVVVVVVVVLAVRSGRRRRSTAPGGARRPDGPTYGYPPHHGPHPQPYGRPQPPGQPQPPQPYGQPQQQQPYGQFQQQQPYGQPQAYPPGGGNPYQR
ncbi:type VII secretion-associated serine protease mycosin [Kitasatospora sp. NPDC049285]|uniref:type VII secretion-associated serine protease mycosin n=1 Tax=Kitasatospora sp. NPDC049285 TaxID=3157096 RepID=UPI003430C465